MSASSKLLTANLRIKQNSNSSANLKNTSTDATFGIDRNMFILNFAVLQ